MTGLLHQEIELIEGVGGVAVDEARILDREMLKEVWSP